ncbi:MAG: hypothetical protein ACFFD2_09980 [Promethearchaeota archaeon]
MTKKNLILGLIKGYNFEQIRPFIISLERTKFKGDLILFYSDINNQTYRILRQYSVKLINFEQKYPFFTSIPITNISLPEPLKNELSIWWTRWIMYYLFLSNLKNRYTKILLTDVRDVIFQRNPFDFESDKELCFFLEDSRMKIDTCHWNSMWIRDLFGEEILAEIGHNYISCAGTIIGTPSKLLNYLRKFMEILSKIDISKLGPQGVHNYLIYTNKIDNYQFFENENGPILTLHHKKFETIRFNKRGLIINDNENVVNIIHQYDRHPSLVKIFFKKYTI